MLNNFFKKLGEPIIYFPKLKQITGSTKSALLLSQFLIWQSQSIEKDGFYKTHIEITEETGLSMEEQKTAIKLLKSKNVLKVIRKGVPAKNYYYVYLDKINEILSQNYE